MAKVSINKEGDVPNNVDPAMKIFEEHGNFIHSVIRFNVNNEAEAEDLFQDFFLSLISKPIPDSKNDNADSCSSPRINIIIHPLYHMEKIGGKCSS